MFFTDKRKSSVARGSNRHHAKFLELLLLNQIPVTFIPRYKNQKSNDILFHILRSIKLFRSLKK